MYMYIYICIKNKIKKKIYIYIHIYMYIVPSALNMIQPSPHEYQNKGPPKLSITAVTAYFTGRGAHFARMQLY